MKPCFLTSKCPEMQRRGFTPLGDQPSDDSNIPLEDDGHNNSDADDDLFPPPVLKSIRQAKCVERRQYPSKQLKCATRTFLEGKP